MDTTTAVLVVQGLVSALPAFVGFLAVRSLKQIDKKLDSVDSKVDDLGRTDTEIKIELAELRVRVTHLEFLVSKGVK